MPGPPLRARHHARAASGHGFVFAMVPWGHGEHGGRSRPAHSRAPHRSPSAAMIRPRPGHPGHDPSDARTPSEPAIRANTSPRIAPAQPGSDQDASDRGDTTSCPPLQLLRRPAHTKPLLPRCPDAASRKARRGPARCDRNLTAPTGTPGQLYISAHHQPDAYRDITSRHRRLILFWFSHPLVGDERGLAPNGENGRTTRRRP